ncbi:hypothetical protein FPANT_4096 [Fusarium pseudoanthophilum]|uniref:Uncharacterized protein n=1 Tax=Fusarium pseudoanthophilum TaxID=48495 RepID=A0A8H5UTA1_9HYPO|nr:hypothetical protein FPANT_4096 [Fusarium pseudoanthophilum]
MDIARVLAVRSHETDERHRPGSFDDAAYTALRYLREGGQISDLELDGGPLVRHSHRDYQRRGCAEFRSCLEKHAQPVSVSWLHGWDKDEELHGIPNIFGFDDAGTFCNSQFDTRASAPLVVGVHLVNVTLPQESNLNTTYRCQGFLRLQPPTYLSDAGHALLNAPNWKVLEPVRQFMATRHTTAGHSYDGPDTWGVTNAGVLNPKKAE